MKLSLLHALPLFSALSVSHSVQPMTDDALRLPRDIIAQEANTRIPYSNAIATLTDNETEVIVDLSSAWDGAFGWSNQHLSRAVLVDDKHELVKISPSANLGNHRWWKESDLGRTINLDIPKPVINDKTLDF